MFTKRYVITYRSDIGAAYSSRCVGGLVFRTRRGADRQMMRFLLTDTRSGEYSVARIA